MPANRLRGTAIAALKPEGADFAVVPLAALTVAGLVEREDHLGAELAAFFKNLIDQFAVGVGVRRHFGKRSVTCRSSCSTNCMSRSGSWYCPIWLFPFVVWRKAAVGSRSVPGLRYRQPK